MEGLSTSKSPCAEEQCSHLLFLERGPLTSNQLTPGPISFLGSVEINRPPICLPNTWRNLAPLRWHPACTVPGVLMNPCRSQDEISSKLLAAATAEALVTAAKSGDRPAFAELWERHSNRAFKMASRMIRNREDAKEAIQD